MKDERVPSGPADGGAPDQGPASMADGRGPDSSTYAYEAGRSVEAVTDHDAVALDRSASKEPTSPGAATALDGSVPLDGGRHGSSAAEVRARLGAAGITNPLPALVVGMIAYLGALAVSAMVLVLSMVGVAILMSGESEGTSGGEVQDASAALDGIGALVRMPFGLAALGGFGSFGGSADGVSASIRFLPLAVTAAYVLLSWGGGRLVARRAGTTQGAAGAAVSSLLGGLLAAAVGVLAARLAAQPLTEAGISGSVHAAGFDAFAGIVMLVAGALLLGQLSVRPRGQWWSKVADLASAGRLAMMHAIVFATIAGAAVWLYLLIRLMGEGEVGAAFGILFLVPLLCGQLIAGLAGLGMLGSVSGAAHGGLGILSGSVAETASVFAFPWYVAVLALLLGLVMIVLVSIVWASGRRIVPGSVVAVVVSWAALPVAYFAGAVVLMVIGHVGGSASYEGQVAGSASVGLAPWLPLLALLVGALVELVSRFVAPIVLPYLPSALLGWFGRVRGSGAPLAGPAASEPETVALAPAADALVGEQGVGEVSSRNGGSSASAPGESPSRDRVPLSRRAKRRILIGGIAAGGALLLVTVGVIAYSVALSKVYSPDKPVEAYLDHLKAGDFGAAADMAPPNVPTAQRALLTDEIGSKTEQRISDYSIDDVETEGGTAIVTATVTQDGVRTEQSFTVEKQGRTALIFPDWGLGDVVYSTTSVAVSDQAQVILVNGVKVDVSKASATYEGDGYRTLDLPAAPGMYVGTLEAPNDYVTAQETETLVPVPGSAAASAEESAIAPYFELNDTGKSAIEQQVHEKLAGCISAATTSDPDGCPVQAFAYSSGGGDPSGTWTVTEDPTIEIEQDPTGGGGWVFSTPYAKTGSAQFTYESTDFSGAKTMRSEESSISVSGTAVIDDSGELVVTLTEGY